MNISKIFAKAVKVVEKWLDFREVRLFGHQPVTDRVGVPPIKPPKVEAEMVAPDQLSPKPIPKTEAMLIHGIYVVGEPFETTSGAYRTVFFEKAGISVSLPAEVVEKEFISASSKFPVTVAMSLAAIGFHSTFRRIDGNRKIRVSTNNRAYEYFDEEGTHTPVENFTKDELVGDEWVFDRYLEFGKREPWLTPEAATCFWKTNNFSQLDTVKAKEQKDE